MSPRDCVLAPATGSMLHGMTFFSVKAHLTLQVNNQKSLRHIEEHAKQELLISDQTSLCDHRDTHVRTRSPHIRYQSQQKGSPDLCSTSAHRVLGPLAVNSLPCKTPGKDAITQ